MLFDNGQMYPVFVYLVEKSSQVNWEAITAVVAFFAAMFTGWAALSARNSVIIMRDQQESTIAPCLGIVDGFSMIKTDERGYPCFLKLQNLASGPATLLAVDLDRQDIRCDVSTPVNIGPGSIGGVQLWLPEPDKPYKVRLGVYYWDIKGNCYASQWSMRIKYYDPLPPQKTGYLDWRISSARIKKFQKPLALSEEFKVVDWRPPKDLFDPSLTDLSPYENIELDLS